MERLFVRLIGIIFCGVFLVSLGVNPASAEMKKYLVSLGTETSGNTTGSISSEVTTCFIPEGYDIPRSGANDIPINGGLCIMQITGVTVSQAQQGLGGSYSDNAFSVYVKGTFTDKWDEAKKYPVLADILSGDTVEPVAFYAPMGSKMRVCFGPTGVTQYDGFTAYLFTDVPHAWEGKVIDQKVKRYTLSIGTSNTGNTTVPVTGASQFVVTEKGYGITGEKTSLENLDQLPSGSGMLWIKTITISQAQQGIGGSYTNNTSYVAMRSIPINGNWDLSELIPICSPVAMSGATPCGIPFSIEPGTETRFYFVSSGTTAYDNAIAEIVVGLSGTDWRAPKPIHTGASQYAMNSGNGDVSLIIPEGTRYVEVNAPYSGGSVYYTYESGIALGGTAILPGSTKGFCGTRPELQRIKIGAPGVAATANVDCWSLKQ